MSNIDPTQLPNFDVDLFQNLSPEERKITLQILQDLASKGSSSLYNDLWAEDYDEVPVDIDTFLDDDNYLGKVTENGKIIYPYWREVYRKLFDPTRSYTECLTGDTMIPLLDGTEIRMDELVTRLNSDNPNNIYVYSYNNELNEYTIGKVTKGIHKGKRPVYKVTLSTGESFKATGNHLVLLRNNHWISVDKLKPNDSLMPFELSWDERGYTSIMQPKSLSKEPVHRMVMRWKRNDYTGVVHHKDFNKSNNNPENLLLTTWMKHKLYHYHHVNKLNYNKDFQKKAHDARWSKPENIEKVRQQMIEYNHDHPNKLRIDKSVVIDSLSKVYNINKACDLLGISRTGLWGLINQYGINPEDYLLKSPISFPSRYWGPRFSLYNKLYLEYGELTDEIVRANTGPHSPVAMPSNVIKKYFNGDTEWFMDIVKNYNHKVLSVELLPDEEDVYDIEIDNKYHNFAISSGVVVHNCILSGAIGFGM